MTGNSGSFGRRGFWLLGSAVIVLLLLVVVHGALFNFLGHLLVANESPQKADMIVVLAGDYSGSRMLRAAELARQGYASMVLMSGGTNFYETDEPHAAVELAVHHGYNRSLFLPIHNPVDSTVTEARAVIVELRKRHVHRFLLVTTALHSARAARIFRREARDLECHPVVSSDDSFLWWTKREGRKAFFFESLKTVSDVFRI